MNSLNISPQSPSSAINFIDKADEAQLKAMVAARNGYSAIALSKLQSIRDAKMKAQAGQPTPPPLSESIPQQLDQLESPMGMPQQAPQQMPQQAPQQAMGIASIGGSPTGAGGGMVAFKDGGGIRRFADPNGEQLVTEESTSRAGDFLRSFLPTLPTFPKTEEEARQRGEIMQNRRAAVQNSAGLMGEARANYISPFTASTPAQRELSKERGVDLANRINALQAAPVKTAPLSADYGPFEGRPAGGIVNSAGGSNNAAIPSTTSGDTGSIGIAGMLRDANRNVANFTKDLTTPFADVLKTQKDVISAMEQGQKDLAKIYSPEERQKALGSQADRDKYLEDRQKRLQDSMPDPYIKTQQSLDSLQKQLGQSKENSSYQSLLAVAAKMMSNRSPNFLSALGDAGAVGLQTLNELEKANKQQELSLMQAQTSLSSAQDARRNNQYDRAANEMKDYFSAKKDAYEFGVEVENKKVQGQIAIAGAKAKIPETQVQQAQAFYSIGNDIQKYNLQIADLKLKNQQLGIEGQKLDFMKIPEEARVALFLSKNPQFSPAIQRAEDKSSFAKNYAIGKKDQDKTNKTDDELIADAIKAVSVANKTYPAPMTFGAGS